MKDLYLGIKPEDLDEASIFLFRIWAFTILGEEPEALILMEPEYIVIAQEWVLYCNRLGPDIKQISLIASDTHKPIVCVSPNLISGLCGFDLRLGLFNGPDKYRLIIEALERSAMELPPASLERDPQKGRWITKSFGQFEIWKGRTMRLICDDIRGEEYGYTWDSSQPDIYFYRSKTCKREGRNVMSGHFKFSEQKRDRGVSHWNIDLLSEENKQAALMHLTPAGAGYKVFTRQLPRSFTPISFFYTV